MKNKMRLTGVNRDGVEIVELGSFGSGRPGKWVCACTWCASHRAGPETKRKSSARVTANNQRSACKWIRSLAGPGRGYTERMKKATTDDGGG